MSYLFTNVSHCKHNLNSKLNNCYETKNAHTRLHLIKDYIQPFIECVLSAHKNVYYIHIEFMGFLTELCVTTNAFHSAKIGKNQFRQTKFQLNRKAVIGHRHSFSFAITITVAMAATTAAAAAKA